jgi:hypothetical protein
VEAIAQHDADSQQALADAQEWQLAERQMQELVVAQK